MDRCDFNVLGVLGVGLEPVDLVRLRGALLHSSTTWRRLSMSKRKSVLTALPLLVLLWFPAHALAQSSSTGAIAGAARDTTGAVVPGVTVEAASPGLIEKVRTVVTDS